MSDDNKAVSTGDLQIMSSQTGSGHRLRAEQASSAVMQGDFFFRSLGQGVSIHGADVTELQNAENAVELEPCLSINLLFRGEVSFCLGGQSFRMGNSSGDSAEPCLECFALILNRTDVMTRYLVKNQRVRKLNLSVSRSWLEARCHTPIEKRQLALLFSSHGVLQYWSASLQQKELAEKLMRFDQSEGICEELAIEQRVVQLVGLCIERLIQMVRVLSVNSGALCNEQSPVAKQLKRTIEERLGSVFSVADIAEANSMSVSSLQRRFKKYFNMTVNEYVRLRRLDAAKRAMTIEGLTIGEAAYLAGYNHSSNFIAAFKRQFSMTPAELVRRHRGGEKQAELSE